jgi:flagellar assembly protein FliH
MNRALRPLRPTALIASEDIAQVSRWRFGAVGTSGVPGLAFGEPEAGIADPQALRAAHAEGYAEGVAAGRAEALAQAEADFARYRANEALEVAGRMDALLRSVENGLDQAQQEIARGTLEIACALARQVVRRELAVDPKALEPVVHEALSLLLVDARSASVRLAPVDFELLDEPLRTRFTGQPVTVLADAAVRPGDCLVESAGAVVDGGLASRWSRAIASLGLALPWNEEDGDDDRNDA